MINKEMVEDILKFVKRKGCYLTQKQIAKGVWVETQEELQELIEALKYLCDVGKLEKKTITKKVRKVVETKVLFGLVY